ncbi:MAG: phosphate/phosphite/phosphonate ABC transporter substrate-binding protein [Candidatus Nitrosocaldaceae archaeon]
MRSLYILIPIVLAIGIGIGYIASTQANTNQDIIQNNLEQKRIVTIAIQPTAKASDIEAQAKDLEQFLESKTGYNIEIYIPTSYAGVVEALRFGKADIAFMSAWPSYLAVKKSNATLELAEVREVIIDGIVREETYYYSYWVVPKDSPYDSLDDLRGKKAAFPNPLSTSGYVMPMKRMLDIGLLEVEKGKEVDPTTYFSDVIFAGGYSQAWEALKNGKVDVSIIAGDVSEKLYSEVMENTKVIEQQGPIPSHGVVFSKNIDPIVKNNIKNALLQIGNDEDSREIMKKLVSAIFIRFKETNSDDHLGSLIDAIESTGLRYTEKM